MNERVRSFHTRSGRLADKAWRWILAPAARLLAFRMRELICSHGRISYERLAGCVFVFATLAFASQVLSPAADHSHQESITTPAGVAPEIRRDRSLDYAWLKKSQRADYVPLVDYLVPPDGYTRVNVIDNGFADWLRHLPIAPIGTPVTTGGKKTVLNGDDSALGAVIALQPNSSRLLSGANMLIRLRCEYAWSVDADMSAAFHFTSGHFMSWSAWCEGIRPQVNGRNVKFKKRCEKDDSRSNFCGFMETLFHYTSSLSILDDTRPAEDMTLAAGDIFLGQGRDAPPLMVIDAATDGAGDVRVLLGRAGIPAQTFHVIRADNGSPWFSVSQKGSIELGGHRYDADHLRRWVR